MTTTGAGDIPSPSRHRVEHGYIATMAAGGQSPSRRQPDTRGDQLRPSLAFRGMAISRRLRSANEAWNESRLSPVSRDGVGPPMIDRSLGVFREWGLIARRLA
jgi:hypothetical protein